jgi:1-pyrroline-5-carboxylate dehydrogenase
MSNAFYKVPPAKNELIKSYAPGTPERDELKQTLKKLMKEQKDIPMYIGGKEVRTGKTVDIRPPHNHKHKVGQYHKGDSSHVKKAIEAAMKAKTEWEFMPWEQRAAIFLRAADLMAGPYRAAMNAATMIGQSKNAFQAEIDAVCELVDFFRFNVQFMTEIYHQQPESLPLTWNRTEHRALEGFVFALTPFNFTSIAGNLPSAPALMGNTVVWKPSNTQIYGANMIMEIFNKAGLPPGVINLVYVSGPEAGDVIFSHKDFGGIHFTGSTEVFNGIWKTVANNIDTYKSYPRLVGETGGKDFVVAHSSADPKTVAVALARGAFEYQGQKCSAASRAYVPASIWKEVKQFLCDDLASFKMGDVEDFSNFINAVIDEKSFDKISNYIANAKKDKNATIIAGGKCDKSKGYFIQPTVIQTTDPYYTTMCEEIFGPVLTIYVYDDKKFEATLDIVDKTSGYALTGAIIANDRDAVVLATRKLTHAAGNFYINDKPTGAVVGQQPFGGARKSGTNDKAGSMINLLRWVSPRSIKENFVPPTDYRYPFMQEEKKGK